MEGELAKTDLPPAGIQDALRYDPGTGNFHHLRVVHKFGGLTRIGDIAGRDSHGYVAIGFKGITYKAHRLAWYFMTGDWLLSSQDVDHIDTNRANNAWSNLRLVSRSQNIVNVSKNRIDNQSGKRGVCWSKEDRNWRAAITFGKKRVSLGRYATLEEAVQARRLAEIKHFGHECGA